ncbi:MAG: 1-deoxy-D-xylulose-5-phosphate synthase [Opitutales bacterium]|nr:1-deoxy-D-xylulose-5-phosphate synthase [Opitutales bacterium]
MLVEKIKSSADVHCLSQADLKTLADEVRGTIIRVTSKNGGHVAPNLGVVELTIALHKVFDFPTDKIVFDVSHQCYTHKLLTGRAERFETLRTSGGLSGFCRRDENPADAFGAGHAGTAISAAMGLAAARDRLGGNEHVIAVVGDASLTNGVSFEALNILAETTKRLIVVLNDNEWSIDRNVGATAELLNRLIMTPAYNKITRAARRFVEKFIPFGKQIVQAASQFKKGNKSMATHGTSSIFEHFKLRYLGPVDGHNIPELCRYLEFAKTTEQPILLHVRTQKGRGLAPAIANPEKFHGCAAYDPETGTVSRSSPLKSWQQVFGESLVKLAAEDSRIVGITAAMAAGTSLNLLKKAFPQQYFDVGIAEENAVVMAAGMAARGLKPCVAIYSTFMQRAIDMVMHDVCLQNLPVVFCLDRAGLSPQDGATHHGLYDLSMMRCLPNLILMQPKDDDELADMLKTAFDSQKPCAIRYSRGPARGVPVKAVPAILPIGKAQIVREPQDAPAQIFIWALGAEALELAHKVAAHFAGTTVVNARFCKPLDTDLLFEQARRAKVLVTVENHAIAGGFGSAVLEALAQAKISVPVEQVGWPDRFVPHASTAEDLEKDFGLTEEAVVRRLQHLIGQ